MQQLKILRAKPNPSGKDKYGSYAPNSQQVAEWIDIQNVSGQALTMTGVALTDRMFNNSCYDEGRRTVYTFGAYSVPANTIIRIHSGDRVNDSALAYADQAGAHIHLYTGKTYVWNNVCGDTAELLDRNGGSLDKAIYFPNPIEGKILERYLGHLI